MSKRVLLLQRRMPKYRMALFEVLTRRLEEKGVALTVAYGTPSRADALRRDEGFLEAGVPVPFHQFRMGGVGLYYLDLPRETSAGKDLIILPHENGILLNYLMLRRAYGHRRSFAFFGHGANLQSRQDGLFRSSLKAWLARRGNWYFAYTALSLAKVHETGFPLSRITCLNNTVDVVQLYHWREMVAPDELAALQHVLGIGGEHPAVFIGSLTQDRMLEKLFGAAVKLRETFPDFQLVVVGDGPERPHVQAFARAHPWTRWAGAKHGREKVLHALLGKVMLNPGMVGLNIIDSLALGIPMVTTDCGIHSPEIIYLENGRNGFITSQNTVDFVACVARLLGDEGLRRKIAANAMEDARKYTLEQMVENFADGVLSALEK